MKSKKVLVFAFGAALMVALGAKSSAELVRYAVRNHIIAA